jgi:hypothetical protein
MEVERGLSRYTEVGRSGHGPAKSGQKIGGGPRLWVGLVVGIYTRSGCGSIYGHG